MEEEFDCLGSVRLAYGVGVLFSNYLAVDFGNLPVFRRRENSPIN